MESHTRIGVVLLVLAQGLAGCRGPVSPSGVPAAPPGVPGSTVLQPVIGMIVPNAGTTSGGTWGSISGSAFQPGVQVTFGGRAPGQIHVQDSTTILFWETAPHAAGPVDVAVTNPRSQAATLAGGYTYASPDSLAFSGSWLGHAGPDYEIEMRFTIQNDVLTTVSCGTFGTLTLPVPVPVSQGEFSSSGNDGAGISGRIVSAANAVGTINIAPCPAGRWWGERVP